MIKYKCDMCGVEGFNKKDIGIFTLPRRIIVDVTDAVGTKLKEFDTYGLAETHICETCCVKMAHMFSRVESSECQENIKD